MGCCSALKERATLIGSFCTGKYLILLVGIRADGSTGRTIFQRWLMRAPTKNGTVKSQRYVQRSGFMSRASMRAVRILREE